MPKPPVASPSPSPTPPPTSARRVVLTKADLANRLNAQLDELSKKQAADLVDLIFETMKETLGRGEKIKISGFGNFVLRDKDARVGRNPQTESPMTIRARRVLTFRPSQVLRHDLNGWSDPTERTRG